MSNPNNEFKGIPDKLRLVDGKLICTDGEEVCNWFETNYETHEHIGCGGIDPRISRAREASDERGTTAYSLLHPM